MDYIEVKLMPTPFAEETCDILAALLAPLGFDSFATEGGETSCLKAYISEITFNNGESLSIRPNDIVLFVGQDLQMLLIV